MCDVPNPYSNRNIVILNTLKSSFFHYVTVLPRSLFSCFSFLVRVSLKYISVLTLYLDMLCLCCGSPTLRWFMNMVASSPRAVGQLSRCARARRAAS